jgi:hypothetical protein
MEIIVCNKKLKTPFCNFVCHSRIYTCVKFGYIIMNFVMDVVISLIFGFKAKINQTCYYVL